jgi:hypothetical protein
MDFSEIKYKSTGGLPLKILAKLKAKPASSIDLVYYYVCTQFKFKFRMLLRETVVHPFTHLVKWTLKLKKELNQN